MGQKLKQKTPPSGGIPSIKVNNTASFNNCIYLFCSYCIRTKDKKPKDNKKSSKDDSQSDSSSVNCNAVTAILFHLFFGLQSADNEKPIKKQKKQKDRKRNSKVSYINFF